MNKFRKVVAAVAAIALLVMGGTAVFAQQSDDGQHAFAQHGQQGRPGGKGGGRGRDGRFIDREVMLEAIADVLGITVDELEAAREAGTRLPELAESLGVEIELVEDAITAVRIEGVEQAAADGEITQEQADRILEQIELQNVVRDILDRDAMMVVVADTLGITAAEVEAADEAGVKLPQLAEEAGVDMRTVHDAINQAKIDGLQEAVDNGLITQEQAYRLVYQYGQRGNNHSQHPQGHPQGGHGDQGHPQQHPQGGHGNQGHPQGHPQHPQGHPQGGHNN